MVSVKKINRGFSTLELLIVMVITCILASLILATHNAVQRKDRDTKRKEDINTIYAQLEAYQAQNGKYPTLANLNVASFRAANLKGLHSTVLQDPKGKTEILATKPQANSYAYVATPINCDNITTDCTGYTLTATLEAGGTYVKETLLY